MCKLLDEPQKTGNAKASQLKNWKRYFSFEKSGHKFLIAEVFEKPKTEKGKNNSVYRRPVCEVRL